VGRKVDVDDLVSAADIAERCGTDRPQIVYEWATRFDDFPAPIKKVGRVTIYIWPDVAEWLNRQTDPRIPRPR